MSFLSSVASSLGGFGNSLLQGFTNEYFSRRDIKYKDGLNWQHWLAQNEYNSPAAQMQRFREAGLNPNLIYGQSNLAGSVSPASGGVSVDSPLSNVYTREQMRNLKSQNDNLVAQNGYIKEQEEALRIDNKLRRDAGPLADAPWYWRMIYRSLPEDWKKGNGDLDLSRLSMSDIGRAVLSIMVGGSAGMMQGFNPVYNVGGFSLVPPFRNVPPRGSLINQQDRGKR